MKKIIYISLLMVLSTTQANASLQSGMLDDIANASQQIRRQALDTANHAAQTKGLTLEALGKVCNLLPIRIGAILSGQAQLENSTQACLEKQLDLKIGTLDTLGVPPVRSNSGGIYRLHEAMDVYAPAIQRWMNERFGDAILSAIDFTITAEESKGSHGERRIRIIFDGKALPYSTDESWRPR
ncbi:CynS Cyanate lyase [uncultured Caudovirales phage]|uniref:CynS Cyanate lyase n=1 Tax=uncultured Caudovirales phage TaxID=2100421 RepID=A0A6J5PYE2_9CAUD|nr:CynS Cyanate lyase [uncultured Caudovirales phage]CAB4170498.1 CynS Cyanate lyase [uncultured Caudovirales phage]CAB4176939.1 CynS Cyanate lyase [uncultured Caudovirales phage]CAB4222944.1 CynS Cyanate lyase [uncultured Caudovirales phage]